MQDPLSRPQREGLRPSHSDTGHGGPQVGRIFAHEETLRVQVRPLIRPHFSWVNTDMALLDTRRTSRRHHALGTPFCVWYSLKPKIMSPLPFFKKFLAVRRSSTEPRLKFVRTLVTISRDYPTKILGCMQ
jgi:hypothetical protein